MNARRKLRREEKRKLQIKAQRMFLLVNKILKEEFGRKMFYLKKPDQYRLLVLDVWRERYKVTVRFILKRLVPYYQARISKWQKRRYTDGLGIRVATLVGVHSEQILKEAIQQEFPDAENWDEWRWKRRLEILKQREKETDDGIATREKTVQDFAKPERYMKYYQRKTRQKRAEFEKELNNDENKRRPYRGNPWL